MLFTPLCGRGAIGRSRGDPGAEVPDGGRSRGDPGAGVPTDGGRSRGDPGAGVPAIGVIRSEAEMLAIGRIRGEPGAGVPAIGSIRGDPGAGVPALCSVECSRLNGADNGGRSCICCGSGVLFLKFKGMIFSDLSAACIGCFRSPSVPDCLYFKNF